MKLSAALGFLPHFWFVLRISIRAVMLSPSLLLKPTLVSRISMTFVWQLFGNALDENGREVKADLMTQSAHGLVLDLGAGHGHTANYLDRDKVTKYVALEPNTLMHPRIRETAKAAGFEEADGSLVILSCGAEDTESILSSVGAVDTIVSVLTLCSVPSPELTITSLVRDVLKPGGVLLYFEHVRSPRDDVAWWQKLWTPLWQLAFGGCKLDRPTHVWIEDALNTEGNRIWKEGRRWGLKDEPEEHLWWHQVGKYVKMS
ncbi:S-adenosyl-L-methionine-dependent methyltransferase [Pleurotus pulmonarius]